VRTPRGGVDVIDHTNVAIVDFFVVVFSTCMILAPGAKVQPNFSTLRSSTGLSADVQGTCADSAPVVTVPHQINAPPEEGG
jgi:hypothetical protein